MYKERYKTYAKVEVIKQKNWCKMFKSKFGSKNTCGGVRE